MKTYNYRRLVGNSTISSTYDRLNLNSAEINSDLTELYADILSVNETIQNHFDAISNNHGTDAIENDTELFGESLSETLQNINSQIDAIVISGTEVDPRLSQALVDFLGVTWTNFKDLQDFWQKHNVIFNHQNSKYYTVKDQISATGKPQLIYEEVI